MSLLRKSSTEIQSHVNVIDSYLTKHNLPQPSFAADSPTGLPDTAEVQQARLLLIETASALANLATGSADHLRWHMMNHTTSSTRCRDGRISYSELSKKINLGEHRLRRVLAMAYTQHYFYEPEPGYVAHASNSAIGIGDPLARGWILHNVDEVQPWYTNKISCGDAETGGAVKGTNLLRGFDWKGLCKATVVDVRNQLWYEKKFYEQLPPEVHSRFTYMPHDNYSEQPIKCADVYFMATVLHKEPDEKAITILRRTVEAMDPKKSRIVTRDIIMDGGDPPPEDAVLNGKAIDNRKGVHQPGLGPTGAITRLNIGIDFQVCSAMNAFERNREEWVAFRVKLFNEKKPKLAPTALGMLSRMDIARYQCFP
ncbi:hypothetical protein DL765_009961 [Monosporascus sp. GIB2]|nr:hypothetical protein DL765_009961 [Monosporascus sp. GIB2]